MNKCEQCLSLIPDWNSVMLIWGCLNWHFHYKRLCQMCSGIYRQIFREGKIHCNTCGSMKLEYVMR